MAVSRSNPKGPLRRKGDGGYVLLGLMLIVTLLLIAAAVAAPTMAFEIKRDREQEMIHRGVQYSRAIRNYYKKFGRYPTRLEDLDNTNNLRYLRKHYKDPLNKNKEFKLLHYGDPGVTLTGSLGSTPIPGANTVGQLNAGGAGASAFGSGASGGSAFSQSSGFGGGSNSAFGGNSNSFGGGSNSAFGGGSNNSASSGTNGAAGGSNPAGTTPPSGTDPSQTGAPGSQDSSSAQGSGTGGSSSQGNQVFGGGPIVGVASLNKDTTIREFNKKKKYNEWQFVYDPTTDRGGLLTTPNQPALQFGNQNLNGQNGQPGSAGTSNSPFGSSGSSFGQQSGFGNNNQGFSGGATTPAQPQSNPPNNN